MIFRRSLISEMTNTAGGVFTVLFSIILTVAIVRVLGRVAGGRYDGEAILQLLLYTSLNFLAPLLAMSLFLAVLITLIRSWMQNEMVVWFSSGGLSLLAWIRPVLQFAFPVILLTALVSLAIGPWARAQTEVSRKQFSQRDDASRVVSAVKTMAMPLSSAAAMTSSSRMEPPGWMTQVAPASQMTSNPSRNGKKASDAAAHPRRTR